MEVDIGWVTALLLVLATLYLALRRPAPTILVTDLVFYPIKGCVGTHLKSAVIDETGMQFDHMWAICDKNHNLVNLKADTRLNRLIPELLLDTKGLPSTLILHYGEKTYQLPVDKEPNGEIFEVEMSKQPRKVRSEGEIASAMLKEIFNADYDLIRAAEPSNPYADYKPSYAIKVNLAAALHLHLTTEKSLEALRQALPDRNKTIQMSVFRANIVVNGSVAFDEDTWAEMVINGVRLVGLKPVKRCAATIVDPETLEFDEKQEPMRTLTAMHSVEGLPMFGEWLVRRNNGVIRVGDRVEVVRRKVFSNKITD
jgi:hypothetical protein